MDPNANLREQLALASRIIEAYENDRDVHDIARDANELAERVLALREWIANGGFQPDWRQQ
jgi:hypothetical protein